MNRSLVETYYYGHGDWPSVFSPAADSVYRQPLREMQMVSVARQQLAAQERARKDIVRSNIAGAQIIACEMERQTQALEGAIQGMGRQVTDAIGASADQITGAIEEVGQALCMELSEIRWQLAQQSATLERILEVLAESRSNETRQLVRQGLRHYLNGEYAEAEERFRKALDFDTTDYQVLMNLAFISLHKNGADEAFSFFKKALSLPEDLDDASKARNLWATARLFYSQKDFAQAQVYAEKAFQYEQVAKAEGLFKLGVYEALAGREDKAIRSLRNAINMDPALFARAATASDLSSMRDQVLAMLSELALKAFEQAAGLLHSTAERLQRAKKIAEGIPQLADSVQRLTGALARIEGSLRTPSFTGCQHASQTLEKVQSSIAYLEEACDLYRRKQKADAAVSRAQEALTAHNATAAQVPASVEGTLKSPIAIIIGFIGFVYGFSSCSSFIKSQAGGAGDQVVGGIFGGAVIAVVIACVAWMLVSRWERVWDRLSRVEALKAEHARKASALKSDVNTASSALSAIEASIREKDREMKEAYESLCVKGSTTSGRAGDLAEE